MADPPKIPPVTNLSPEEVLAKFSDLGVFPISMAELSNTHLRVVVSRGLRLAATGSTPEEHAEFDAVYQELAMRMMGRNQAFK